MIASIQGWFLSALHPLVSRKPFSGRGVLEYLSARLFRGALPVRVRPGVWISLDLSDDYERQVFMGNYEEPLLRFFRSAVHAGDVFIDAGANIGVHMLNAAVCVGPAGRVRAFEPEDATHARAAANVASNPSLAARISLRKLALGDRQGTVAFEVAGDRGLEGRVVAEGKQVPCSTLDLELEAGDLAEGRVVLCKIDVEGYEQHVLDGATRLLGREDTIFVCELNDPLLRANDSSADALISRMVQAGYTSWNDQGEPLVRHDPTWVPWVNGVFAKGPRAVERVRIAYREH